MGYGMRERRETRWGAGLACASTSFSLLLSVTCCSEEGGSFEASGRAAAVAAELPVIVVPLEGNAEPSSAVDVSLWAGAPGLALLEDEC